MTISKMIRQICATAMCVTIGASSVFAADTKPAVENQVTAVSSVTEGATNAAVPTQYAVVTAKSGLKLRKEASTASTMLSILSEGSIVDVDRVGSEWIRVLTDDGQKGYVSADYVSIGSGKKPVASVSTRSAGKGDEIISFAKQFIGTPYVWGGTNLRTGVDCSGFVYAVLKNFGINVNRSSASMVSNGTPVEKSDLQAGDLVFFNTGGDSRISHVGIYMGNGSYIHATDGAPCSVTTTSMNSKYSQNTYVTARRVI